MMMWHVKTWKFCKLKNSKYFYGKKFWQWLWEKIELQRQRQHHLTFKIYIFFIVDSSFSLSFLKYMTSNFLACQIMQRHTYSCPVVPPTKKKVNNFSNQNLLLVLTVLFQVKLQRSLIELRSQAVIIHFTQVLVDFENWLYPTC